MAGITGVNENIMRGFGLASDGLKPSDRIDPENNFSPILNEIIDRRNSAPAKPAQAEVPVVPKETHIDRTDELYEQCLALETFLVKNVLNAMRRNVLKSSLIDTGYAGEIYEDMLWDEYAKDYTKNAGFGLADLAYLELTGQRGRKG